MDFRFVAYDPQTGTKLYQLPRATSVNIGDTFGTRGTLELTYSAKAVNARDLPTFLEVQAEVTFDEGHNWAPAGPSLLRLSGEHEDTDQAGMRTLRFVGREWVLGKARVGNGDLELIDGKRPFYRASPGQILRTLILEAQDRGAADGIEIGNFTAAKDSSGKAWAKVATIYYSPGLPIGSVLENLVEQGMCDYRMDGRTIELFDPETTMGRDLTTGNNPVRVHGAVTEAPVKYTLEDLANSALLMGDEGFELEVDNPTAPDDYGRLEVTIEQGGVSDSGTARLMVDEALHRGSREVREITRSQSAAGAAFLPFRDYRVGDYVQVHTGGDWERYRVREIQLARDGQEWTIHTVINDRLQELLLKLAKRTSGIVNGSTGSGGDGTQPTPPAKPGIEPAAPEGLVIDQQVYLDRQGIARGQITAGWGSVTESTKGQAVEIGGYELWWRRNETQETWTRVAVTDGANAVSHSPVVLTDAFGNAMEYQWRVRAIAEASTRPGPFSDIVTMTMTQDTEPPNTPSLPTVTTDLRIVTVDVDGLDEFGEAMPVDFDHTRIYFAPAEDMVGAEQVGTLTQPGSWNSASMTPDVPVWVAVSAVDHVGNESAMTPAQSVTPRKLVDDSSIRDELTGIDDKINDAVAELNESIDNIVIDDTGIATYWMPTEPDETTDPPPKAGFLWFDTSTAGKNKLHRFDGVSWVSAADERIDTIDQAQDDLEADVDRVRTSIDGKNAVTQSTSTPPNQYDGTKGDIWEIMSSMGSGGRSVSRWRWNGTVWVSNLIGDTVLGNVDAAKIGTGYLSADRIDSHSLTADKLLVGGPENAIADDEFFNTAGSPHWDLYRSYTDEPMSWSAGKPTIKASAGAGLSTARYGNDGILPCEPGEHWRLRFQKIRYSPVDEVEYNANIEFLDAAGNHVSWHGRTHFTGELNQTWCEIESIVPEGASQMHLYWRMETAGGDLGFTRPTLSRVVGATLIQNGAITTDKIAAGAITAESGIIGSINAGTITVGEMDGARIKARTIAADKVLIGSQANAIADDEFTNTSGEPYWDISGARVDVARSWSAGKPVIQVSSSDGLGQAYYGGNNTIPCEEGEVWRLKFQKVVFNPPAQNQEFNGNIAYYDAAGGLVSWHGRTRFEDEGNQSWCELESTVPAGAAQMRLYWRMQTDGADIAMTRPTLSRVVGATLIEDGAITTDKILASAITAGKIAALAIEADHISANAITADKINAGAIDSMLITGARIRTAASGRRTELDVEGLKSYDSSGRAVLTTDTSDGSIEMRGALTTSSGQSDSVYSVRVGDRAVTAPVYGAVPGVSFIGTGSSGYREGSVFAEEESVNLASPTLASKPGSVIKAGSTGIFGYVNGSGPGSTGGDDLAIRNNGQWNIGQPSGSGMTASGGADGARFGSADTTAPYLRFRRGAAADDGIAYMAYRHPNGTGYSSLTLKDSSMLLRANNWQGDAMSYLWGDSGGTRLSAGTRNLRLLGKDIFLSASRDVSINPDGGIYMPSLPNDSGATEIGRINGRLHSVYSSRKYKLLEESIESTVESFEDKILSVDAKTWIDRTRADRIAEYQTAIATGNEPVEDIADIGGLERIPGVIAEDFDEAGLEVFVRYDDNGDPQSVAYDRIGPALIPIIRRLRDRVDALETKLGETA